MAAVERVLGMPTPSPDPLAPPRRAGGVAEIDEYERVQTPVYALLYGLARRRPARAAAGGSPSMRIWQMIGGGETRAARLRGWLVGAVAVPGAVGVANRLGLGPVRSDLSAGAIGRAGFEAMGDVIESIGIEADHVIFGHTHRRGGPELGPKGSPGGRRCSSGTAAAGSTRRPCSGPRRPSAPTGPGRSPSSRRTADPELRPPARRPLARSSSPPATDSRAAAIPFTSGDEP